jgi:hypothetical protein
VKGDFWFSRVEREYHKQDGDLFEHEKNMWLKVKEAVNKN